MPNERYLANPDVSCCREVDGAVLFNPDNGSLRAVNAVGRLIWQALAQPCTQQEIVAHVLKACPDVPPTQVDADAVVFLQTLQCGGFVGRVWDENTLFPRIATTKQSLAENILSSTPTSQEHLHLYQGHSMLGTFRLADYLVSEPTLITAIRPGDVVIYRSQARTDDDASDTGNVVHRVMSVRPGGLVTRGDNNVRVDQGLVTQETLLGRVTCVMRDDRAQRIWSGRWGLLYAKARRVKARAERLGLRLARSVGKHSYRRLRASGLVQQMWHPGITRVVVTDGKSLLVKYASRRRTVALWQPETGRFWCRKPFDLVISRPDREAILDEPESRQA